MESFTNFLVVFSGVCSQLASGHYGLDYPPEPNETNEVKDPQHERLFFNKQPDEEFYRELKFRVVGWEIEFLKRDNKNTGLSLKTILFHVCTVKIRLSTTIISCSKIMIS